MYKTNIKGLKGRKKKVDHLEILQSKEWHNGKYLGFLFALCIPDLELKKPTNWKS